MGPNELRRSASMSESSSTYTSVSLNTHQHTKRHSAANFAPTEMKMCSHQSEGSPMTKIQVQCEESIGRPKVEGL